MKNHTVEEIMKGIHVANMDDEQLVVVGYPDYTLASAQELFLKYNLHHLPVCRGKDDNILVGMVSATDIMRVYSRSDAVDASSVKLGDVMTHNPKSIPSSTTVLDAAKILAHAPFQALPVTDRHGEILGIVTTRDLVRFFAEKA